MIDAPSTDVLFTAALRTVPLALCLPLPGLFPRVALGLALASFGAPPEAPLRAIVDGVALGLGVAGPVWAARWAGRIVGGPSRSPLSPLYATLAWITFFIAGGPVLLFGAASQQMPRGAQLFSLAARLALPALLAFAIVEVLAGLASRVEGDAPFEAQRVAAASRPLLAALLALGGLASFAHGVAQALR